MERLSVASNQSQHEISTPGVRSKNKLQFSSSKPQKSQFDEDEETESLRKMTKQKFRLGDRLSTKFK